MICVRKVFLTGVLAAAVLTLCTCAAQSIEEMKRLSSGKIGCPTTAIDISNAEFHTFGSRSWIATCKGKRHICTANVTGKNSLDVSCAPEAN